MSSVNEENAERRVELILATIPDLANRKTLARFVAERKASGVKPTTLVNDSNTLRDLARFLQTKPFEALTKEDVTAFVNTTTRERIWRNGSKDGEETITKRKVRLSATTLSIRKVILRNFYKWLLGNGKSYPEAVEWLKPGRPNGDSIPTDELLAPEDIRRLLQAHTDAREKALLSVLYESGLRAGELCALNMGSVQFDQYGAVLTLPKKGAGLKTGARRVRLYNVESVPYLHAWYENHPNKADPKAPLFYSMSRRAPGARMTPNALWQFVQRATEKAGLKKDVHPHLFRHTAATERARAGWREAEMRAFFGWTRSSDMPATYVHLAGQDYEEMDLERRGLKAKGEPTARSGLAPRVCRVCKAENLSTALFCGNCRSPVSPKAEGELAQRRNEELAQVIREEVQKLLAVQLRA